MCVVCVCLRGEAFVPLYKENCFSFPYQLSQQEERERLRKMAAELKREMEEKERSQHLLSQAIIDKEQELIKARE